MQRLRSLRHARTSAGFTLVELLTVVAIVGILATIGVILVSKHFRASKSLEATAIIQSIRAAQEARRAETASYVNASAQDKWYPAAPDGKTRRAWVMVTAPAANTDESRWRQLAVNRTDGTQFGFKTWAGQPGPVDDGTNVKLGLASKVVFPTANDVWYVIEAAGDLDSDSTYALFWASSFDSELRIQNEGE